MAEYCGEILAELRALDKRLSKIEEVLKIKSGGATGYAAEKQPVCTRCQKPFGPGSIAADFGDGKLICSECRKRGAGD